MKLNLKFHLLFLLIVWGIVQGFFIYSHGIITSGEAEKYISEANTFLVTGSVSTANYRLYFTQIFLLAIAFKTGLGYSLVLIVQLLFSALATWTFYRLANSLFSNSIALVGTLLLLLNYPLQEFNVYLQTESLFFSLTIIFSAYLLRLSKLTLMHFFGILILLAIICITRPTGILFVPATFLYLFFVFLKGINTRIKIIISVAIATIFVFVLNAVLGSGGEWNFMLPYQEEHIICGTATINHNAAINTVPNGNSLFGLGYYIVHNFNQFARLTLLRSKAFFGLLRPYYSMGHNLILAVYFYPVYITALVSINWWLKNNTFRFLYLSCIVLTIWGTTILTCDDWHNRWLLTISPWILLMGLPALVKLSVLLTSNRLKR